MLQGLVLLGFAFSKPHSGAAGQDAFHSSSVHGDKDGLWQTLFYYAVCSKVGLK